MRYFTWKLELVSNILWVIVAESVIKNLQGNLTFGPSCTFSIEKTNFEDRRKRISNDAILIQNSSDGMKNCF